MRIPIELPKLGYDMETATIVGWSKQIGDAVATGDVLLEVETEKATVEIEAEVSGELVEIIHGAGAEPSVGEVIGYLDDGA